MSAIVFEATNPTPIGGTGDVTATGKVPTIRGIAGYFSGYPYQVFVSAQGSLKVAGYAEAGTPQPIFTAGYAAVSFDSRAEVFDPRVFVEDGFRFVDTAAGSAQIAVSFIELLGLADMSGVVYPVALAEAVGLADAAAAIAFSYFAEGLTFGDSASPSLTHVLPERLQLGDSTHGMLDAMVVLGDAISFADIAHIAYRVLMSETVALAGNQTAWRQVVLEIADAMALSSGAGAAWNAQIALASALAFGDSLANVVPGALTDSVQFSDAQKATLQAMVKLLDTLRLADTAGPPSLSLVALVDERMALGGDLGIQQELNALLADGVQFLAQIALDDGVYLAWVMNAETHAFVGYSNYPFNSFATIAGKTYGAKSDGIYLLEGDDDAGAAIDAFARAGLTDFGTSRLKRMPSAYLGYTTDGRLLMKVTAIDPEGVRQEHWYALEERPAGALREGRVKLGRGLKSTYWGFELANVDGADFTLDAIQWYPMVLDRRL